MFFSAYSVYSRYSKKIEHALTFSKARNKSKKSNNKVMLSRGKTLRFAYTILGSTFNRIKLVLISNNLIKSKHFGDICTD